MEKQINVGDLVLRHELDELKKQVEALKALLAEKQLIPTGFVSRSKALTLLNCKRSKLYDLTVKNKIIGYSGFGKTAQFNLNDIKRYLEARHICSKALEERIAKIGKF